MKFDMDVNLIKKGEAFTLPDGTKVLPEPDSSGSKVLSAVEQETAAELKEVVEEPFTNEFADTYKRTLADVNVEPKRMNATMLVVSFSMWGLDNYAIASLLGTTVEAIEVVKNTELFDELHTQMVEAVRYAETSSIHGYLAHRAMDAARVVGSMLKDKDHDRRLSAAKDILDRSGFRPVDRVEHSHKFDDELRIVHIQEQAVPTIDVSLGDD